MKDVSELMQMVSTKLSNVVVEEMEKYLEFCLKSRYGGDSYSEAHHILPQASFPEFRFEEWNIVRLKYVDHVFAHGLLYSALPKDRSAFFAYFMMKSRTGELTEEMRAKNVEMLKGEGNPAKRAEVRKKISKSKTGLERHDMKGKKYFGADEKTLEDIKEKSSIANTGTVPVRLPDGSVIKIRTDDPRYLNGELKCIIGVKKGQRGPNSDPAAKAKFKQTLEERRQRFSKMSGEEIAEHCLAHQEEGKCVVQFGKLSANYKRLFTFANLESSNFIRVVEGKVQRLSKPRQTTKRLF